MARRCWRSRTGCPSRRISPRKWAGRGCCCRSSSRLLAVFLHQFAQVRERVAGRDLPRLRLRGTAARQLELLLVLVIVAVEAQQLPVAAVGRVVVVVVVPMVDGELVQVLVREAAAAASANPRVELERGVAIVHC